MSKIEKQREAVVLLHGLVSHRLGMSPLATRLEDRGYRTENWGYFSFFDSIPKHAERLQPLLRELESDDSVDRIHFVTHSMGGIIVRAALVTFESDKLGRFVMLAPPNRGSHVARILSRITGPTWPSLRQLSDAEDSFVNQLPFPPGLEVGVIAAAPDHVVRIESTKMPSVVAHATVKGPHRVIPFRDVTQDMVLQFLESARFTNVP